MTDNGLAALAAALHDAECSRKRRRPLPSATHEDLVMADRLHMARHETLAAAILAGGAVFLPDGLTDDRIGLLANMNRLAEANADYGAEIDRQAATIATLRAALDGLVKAAEVTVGRFLDTPASLAGVHVAALNDLRAALAAAKETP